VSSLHFHLIFHPFNRGQGGKKRKRGYHEGKEKRGKVERTLVNVRPKHLSSLMSARKAKKKEGKNNLKKKRGKRLPLHYREKGRKKEKKRGKREANAELSRFKTCAL